MKTRAFWVFVPIFLVYSCRESTNQKSISFPADPLQRLIEGNRRFREFHPIHPDQTRSKIRELSRGQHPFAIVLSCSDSRVPPELVFDQGLGDLFVIRTAGHLIDNYELGSIEYAVEHFGIKLIVVLAHEHCGAIEAFLEHRDDRVAGHVQDLLDALKSEPGLDSLNGSEIDILDKAIRANLRHAVNQLNSDEYLESEPGLQIVGAIYHLESGMVEYIY